MKITPCWFVGNWIAAWFQCRLQSRLPRVWATLHQPRCPQRSTSLQSHLDQRLVRRLPAVARAAMAVAVQIPAPLAVAQAKVIPAAAAGAVPAKAPAAAAAKVSN